jgi:hypothetical protein
MEKPSIKGPIIRLIVVILIFVAISIYEATGGNVSDTFITWVSVPIMMYSIYLIICIIVYFPLNAKYKKYIIQQEIIKEKTVELSSPAIIRISRGTNDKLIKFMLKVFNNDNDAGLLSAGESIEIKTKTNMNVLTISLYEPTNNELHPIQNEPIVLELSAEEEVSLCCDNGQFIKI